MAWGLSVAGRIAACFGKCSMKMPISVNPDKACDESFVSCVRMVEARVNVTVGMIVSCLRNVKEICGLFGFVSAD